MSTVRRAAIALVCLAVIAQPVWAGVKVGDRPTLKFVAVDGRRVDLEELRGQLVVVSFWATWCKHCMKEGPHMVQIHKDHADKGLHIIGISLDSDKNKLLKVVKQSGFAWPHYFDGKVFENIISKQWGPDGVPTAFIIGPDGTVLWTGHTARIDRPLAEAFRDHPPLVIKPEVFEQASALLDRVESAVQQRDGFAALGAMAKLPVEAKRNPALRQRAEAVQPELLRLAAAAVNEASDLATKGRYGEAADALRVVVQLFPDEETGKQASTGLNRLLQDPKSAAEIERFDQEQAAALLLDQAKSLAEQKKHGEAYNSLKRLLDQHPKAAAASEARGLFRQYERDPALVRRANDAAAGDKPKSLLNMARNYKNIGKKDEARRRLQEVVDQFPGTSYADEAKKELASMQ